MSTNKQSGDELIGTLIAGSYRILSKLGEGGMGVAYRAWNEQAGIPVVIKIPKKILLEDASFIERFSREIRILQGLSHPNIVPILDVGEHDGLPYVAMRFLPGGSLSNRRLRDDSRKAVPMLPATLHSWLPQIAAALDHVHANGIVHRDVKPANIFFDAFSQAFLGDFGIAKIVEESEAFDRENTLTATSMGIGTQEYMPPEQFTPKAVIDGRADQYALAVMVYEMLAGTRPFTGATAHLIVEVTTKPVPPLGAKRSDLSTALTDAVHRALSKRPDARYSTCTQFADAVLRVVPSLEPEAGVARLLCPKCSKILKLSSDAAGQRGKCPQCHAKMMIADDLGALWLLDEAKQRNTLNAPGSLAEFDESVPGGQELDDGLTDFRPISDSSSKSRPNRQKSVFKNLPFVVGVGVPLLVIVFTVRNSLSVKQVPREATPASKKRELASDREQVESSGKEGENTQAARQARAWGNETAKSQAMASGAGVLVRGTTPDNKRKFWRATSPDDPAFQRNNTGGWTELCSDGRRLRFMQSGETVEYIELQCAMGRDLRIRLWDDGSQLQQNNSEWGSWHPGTWVDVPRDNRVDYSFDKAACADKFVLHGNVSINAKHELECSGGKYSMAVTRERFAAPVRIVFNVYALEDRPFDIFPAVLTDEQGSGGIFLHYGTYWNTRTVLSVFGNNIELPHAPITPLKRYQIIFDVDEKRTLKITRDGDVVYSAMLPANVQGEGHICLGGGIGHVAYTSVSIESR